MAPYTLRNRYLVMRHGESEANRARIIVSQPARGCAGYGLTAAGRAAVARAVRTWGLRGPGDDGHGDRATDTNPAANERTAAGRGTLTAPPMPERGTALTHLYTSDFLRARETAAIVAAACPGTRLIVTELLRERDFGPCEGLDDSRYESLWRDDAAGVRPAGIETPEAVAARMTALLARCEATHRDAVILLVSHGDPLQILLALAAGLAPHQHRRVPHLDKAAIRPLCWEAGPLPVSQ